MTTPKVVLAGGSGFLGRTLQSYFAAQGWEVVVLTRRNNPGAPTRTVLWDGKTSGPWVAELEGAKALVNLAGRSVNCRYHPRNRAAMMNSRVDSTRILGKALGQCESPPLIWLNSSTATIYRHRYDAANTEESALYGASVEAKDTFSLEVAQAWEEAFFSSLAQVRQQHPVRGICLRTAMVFGNEPGGVYETLRKLVRLGLGGRMGHGRQFVSWLHAEDFGRALSWLMENPEAEGIYNLAAPQPLPNGEMMRQLRRALGAPMGLPAPKLLLEVGAFLLRTETELIVKSRRVEPARLLAGGFVFRHPTFATAVEALEDDG
ncbi:TIGR01777 family oxidoreductase [Roseibacillus ishigakijimensis]|uniref:TIGR01777 family oxidoreductase n=1 Tax=Roseibacillus ishigakijimensis TaxID=454146 RepID=A0A934RPB7_9BACT|nr:TIGR01777 family oxidoreductase [Roseibacillus ishigakijimensis]MBK1832644.1 TIGR01777 family oxidoreductase [Roseibacillus ishigakijimensis]